MDFFLFDESPSGKGVPAASARLHSQRALPSLGKQLPFLRKIHAYWQAEAPEQFRDSVQVVGYDDHKLILRCASATQAAALRRQGASICAGLRARHKNLRYLKALVVRAHPHYVAPEAPTPRPPIELSPETKAVARAASARARSPSLQRALAAFAADRETERP